MEVLHDPGACHPAWPAGPLASLLLQRLQGFATPPAAVRPPRRAGQAPASPAPGAGDRSLGRMDRELPASCQAPPPPGQDALARSGALPADITRVRGADEPVAPALQLLVALVQQEMGEEGRQRPPGGGPSVGIAQPSPGKAPAVRERSRSCHTRRSATRPGTRLLRLSCCTRSTHFARARSTPPGAPSARYGWARAVAWCAEPPGRKPALCSAQVGAPAGCRPRRRACWSNRSSTGAMPSLRTPPPGWGISTRVPGLG